MHIARTSNYNKYAQWEIGGKPERRVEEEESRVLSILIKMIVIL